MEELEDISTEQPVSFRESYELRLREWLESDVKLRDVTNPYRVKSVCDGAQKAVNYFTRQRELDKPLTFSGMASEWKLGSVNAMDNYRNICPEFDSLVGEIKIILEEYAEEQLFSKNSNGAKFILMNRAKWSNREVQEITTHSIDVTIGSKS